MADSVKIFAQGKETYNTELLLTLGLKIGRNRVKNDKLKQKPKNVEACPHVKAKRAQDALDYGHGLRPLLSEGRYDPELRNMASGIFEPQSMGR